MKRVIRNLETKSSDPSYSAGLLSGRGRAGFFFPVEYVRRNQRLRRRLLLKRVRVGV